MRFEHFSSPHWSCGFIEKRNMFRSEQSTPDWLKQYFDNWSLLPTNKSLICYIDDLEAGVFRYNLYNNELAAEGTFVHPNYQHKGIASQLWIEALNKENPFVVKVQLASTNGKRLVNKIRKIFKHLEWKIMQYKDI